MPAPLLLLLATIVRTDADTTVHLPRNGAIEIDSRSRDISLRIGTTDIVTIHGASAELDGGTLQLDGEDGRGPIELVVPAWAKVEATSIGGNLTFVGSPARLHAETVNGFIHLTGGSGVVELETVAGGVIVEGFHGLSLSIDATAENVSVTNASGDLEVDNVNGDVILRDIRSNTVSASNINGLVQFDGVLAPSGSYEFSSQNRDITLSLPVDVSATLRISTMNGELTTQIPAVTNGMQGSGTPRAADKGKDKRRNSDADADGEHTLTVVYGGGAARVAIDAFNGNVIVKRRP
ncbi:MAG: hypothetical protein ACREK8_06510 [Gemmatimonadales bacterium]